MTYKHISIQAMVSFLMSCTDRTIFKHATNPAAVHYHTLMNCA